MNNNRLFSVALFTLLVILLVATSLTVRLVTAQLTNSDRLLGELEKRAVINREAIERNHELLEQIIERRCE